MVEGVAPGGPVVRVAYLAEAHPVALRVQGVVHGAVVGQVLFGRAAGERDRRRLGRAGPGEHPRHERADGRERRPSRFLRVEAFLEEAARLQEHRAERVRRGAVDVQQRERPKAGAHADAPAAPRRAGRQRFERGQDVADQRAGVRRRGGVVLVTRRRRGQQRGAQRRQAAVRDRPCQQCEQQGEAGVLRPVVGEQERRRQALSHQGWTTTGRARRSRARGWARRAASRRPGQGRRPAARQAGGIRGTRPPTSRRRRRGRAAG